MQAVTDALSIVSDSNYLYYRIPIGEYEEKSGSGYPEIRANKNIVLINSLNEVTLSFSGYAQVRGTGAELRASNNYTISGLPYRTMQILARSNCNVSYNNGTLTITCSAGGNAANVPNWPAFRGDWSCTIKLKP